MEYFEDLAVGDAASFGAYEVSADEITAFAEQYDPQPFHTDPDAAAETPFGGLVASGWHTASLTMRMLVDNYLSRLATRGAAGVDELRWRTPVEPGATLSVRTEVAATDDWDDETGLVDLAVTTEADGEEAMSMVGLVLVERRN